MSALLIDWGHTRIKWRYLGVSRASAEIDELAAALRACSQVWLSAVDKARLDMVRALSAAPVRLAQSSASFGAVRNGYRDPEQLGVDRWLALIAAHSSWPDQDLFVLDAGSALTLDLLESKGFHLGGYIVAGRARYYRAVGGVASLSSAAQVAGGRGAVGNGYPADTATALGAGFERALGAWLESEWRSFDTDAVVVLSGGDADWLQALLPVGANLQLRPHLVLDGLELYAAAQL